jgi:hypothetical protein
MKTYVVKQSLNTYLRNVTDNENVLDIRMLSNVENILEVSK